MKRVIKIILVVLIIIAIIVLVAWLRTRHNAAQNGTQPPTFRQFLGLGTPAPAVQPTGPGSGLSSDFTDQNDGNNTDTGTTTGGTGTAPTTSSQFTSGPITPAENNQAVSSGNSSSGGGFTGTSGGAGNTVGGSSGSSQGPVATAPTGTGGGSTTSTPASQCSDADTTIAFTPDEIKQLNALQNRFYAIAADLHTDADVQTETANHDTFKAKTDQITELYNYCAVQSPKITAPLYASRITTPFWRDPTKDQPGYIAPAINRDGGILSALSADGVTFDPRIVPDSQSVIEQVFRLNLW